MSLKLFEPWKLRPMPADLRAKYLREGWWDDTTLGPMLTGWLGAASDLTFRVWSRARPQQATPKITRRCISAFRGAESW